MKKSIRIGILALFTLSLAVCLAGASWRPGPYFLSKPEFNPQGQLVAITQPEEGRFFLQILDPSTSKQETRPLPLGLGVGQLVIKKDVQGRLWAIWTEREGSQPKLGLARLGEDLGAPSWLDSPIQPSLPWDCCFDSGGRLWLAWVEDNHSRQDILVRDLDSGQTWTISAGMKEANCPRLLWDAQGSLWIFWTAVRSKQEQIFSRRFSGTAWSPESVLSGEPEHPSITPRAAADPFGNVWLVWSGYDGQDYEILARMWNGQVWSPAMAVTENSGINDVFPGLELAFGVLPVITWVRYTGQDRLAMIRCGNPGEWYDEYELGPLAGEQPFVPLALKDDLAGLVKPDRTSLQGEWFYLPYLSRNPTGKNLPFSRPAPPRQREILIHSGPIYNPNLDESKYIAFGDSITYGVCDEDRIDDPGDYIPDKAYPPRLEALLTQAFGPHQVINAGLPGESTVQGLARIDALLAKYLARYILILEGTNDVIWGDYSQETTSFNLQEMVRKSLDYGLLPALATNIQRYGWYANRPRLTALDIRIRELAGECLIPLVDLFQDFINYPEEDGGYISLYCWGEDRTHPNEKGYQFMAEKWFDRIKCFPFPPAEAQVRRADDDILFFRREGNLIEWRTNPKINDPTQIQEYRIYRKKNAEEPSAFQLLAAVTGKSSYFDSDINLSETYTYVVSTVIADGIEGPTTYPLVR
jgi:lysophospholipase L1-like esterase